MNKKKSIKINTDISLEVINYMFDSPRVVVCSEHKESIQGLTNRTHIIQSDIEYLERLGFKFTVVKETTKGD